MTSPRRSQVPPPVGTGLAAMSPATQAWFSSAFESPTAAQEAAWSAIAGGQHTLVVAPTGSGKTLAAFLSAVDQLAVQTAPAEPRQRCRVLYVSPLKALAVDVERNLRSPLAGIRREAARRGEPIPDITVALRSGDTSAADRRRQASHPPDILITTPESLFLLLTSAARESLRSVSTVIVDEVHAVAGTKRGAHLALSLERLDHLLDRPAQRIGLSATVRPLGAVAAFLGGAGPVEIVCPPSSKQIELQVVVPVDDLSAMGTPTGDVSGSAAGAEKRASVWPYVEERIVDLVAEHRSTLVFANSRRLAERLTARLNEVWSERTNAASDGALEQGSSRPADREAAGSGPVRGQAVPVDDGWEGTPPRSAPAQLMAQAGVSSGAPPVLARAHHGSVSKEQRAHIEDDLKLGRLPAVVATSSLELGIDMGAIDLVVQVESPPSVASGLQRVGRAGHQVGAVSRGVLFPKYRGDLVQTAVVVERMRAGLIEELRVPRNPLDVLAQQIVAALALDDWDVEELLTVIRRAAPFAELPRSAFESVLDMLAGRYPSDEFAELRPRIVWDRTNNCLSGRPGAQRLAVTSGGTIPDRGLFGVFLAGSGQGRRVGELDEEMVYESRVGDVFALGASSWRIEDITHDQVIVTPAPGQPGKMPFWHGDAIGRPYELGVAVGSFLRDITHQTPEQNRARLQAGGLDERAVDNLLAYVAEQREETGTLPDDRTIVVERFRDELGDWRVVIHSVFGARVHAPWALVLSRLIAEQLGIDAQVMHADDGLVLRLPDTEDDSVVAAVADVAFPDPEDIERLVTDAVGGSALFASRFRECAARALLLPRRNPGRRAPLWQQRQRSAQLLTVAARFGSFPIVLETVRECLQDVFEVEALKQVLRDVQARRIRVVDVSTPTPSTFARSLLFGYVAAFMYEGDSPLAERRAAALSLDQSLLAELLGQTELRELLDPSALSQLEAELQYLTPERRARDVEDAADLVRLLGPLSVQDGLARGVAEDWWQTLADQRRVIPVRIAGEQRWAAIEDAARLRDGLGVALPVGLPDAFLEPVADPLDDLISRFARRHGPFTGTDVAQHFGLGRAVALGILSGLKVRGRVVAGEFRPGGSGSEWCDTEVLRRLRRRSVAALRHEAEPVPAQTLGRFLPQWQQVSAGWPGAARGGAGRLRGADGLLSVIEQLAGVRIPASAWEGLVLPARVADYHPAMLDELTAAGEVVWWGSGGLPGSDGWLCMAPVDLAADLVSPPGASESDGNESLGVVHQRILEALQDGGGWFFRPLSERVAARSGGADSGGATSDEDILTALWDLVWRGLITNDTLLPVRAALGSSGTGRPRPRVGGRGRTRPGSFRPRLHSLGLAARPPSRSGPPTGAGRWSLLPIADRDVTRRAAVLSELLLTRYGVLTRGSVVAEGMPGGFAAAYRVLSAFEEAGRCRRTYAVEGLGAAQFATAGAIDRLRELARGLADERRDAEPLQRSTINREAPEATLLAATDPANPYGAALPWPAADAEGSGHRPGRKAGAVVVLVDGALSLYLERGGRSLLGWSHDPVVLSAAGACLAAGVRSGALGRLTVQRANGNAIHGSPIAEALEAHGFRATPKGVRLRAMP